MKLSSIMTTDVVTIGADDSLDEAIALFDRHSFRHLPVVRRGALVSLLSRRTLAMSTGWLTADENKRRGHRGPELVTEIMQDRIVSLGPDHDVETAASMMIGKRAGAIPILEDSVFVGIVTATDLLGAIRKRNPRAEWGGNAAADAKVSEYMMSKLETLTPERNVAEAAGICRRKDLRHVAITEEGAIVGLVSERELRFGLEDTEVEDDAPLSEVMVTEFVTIGPNEDLCAAADSMIENGVSALPVVMNHELVGLLRNSDVIQHFTAKYRVPPIV
ncbi:MAG: CBS domain-containing protein [Planctomycetota bacterium]|jgi:CBS domain-containing protein